MLKKSVRIFRSRGFAGLSYVLRTRVQRLLVRRAKSYLACQAQFSGKSGIEIGGPSQVFSRRGVFPVYPIVQNLDNCNFAQSTVWECGIKQGQTFKFERNKPAGRQYISEATELGGLVSGSYDFVLSSHVLEHCANPILALSEWIRLLKDQGALVLLLPLKEKTFDHRRPVTTIEHLISDYKAGMKENDLTHMAEILALHDLDLDPEAGDAASFKKRSERNFENRCFHHHVFDTDLAVRLVEYMGLQIQAVEELAPYHILIVAKKLIKVQAGQMNRPAD